TGDLSGWVRACSVFTAGTCSGALRSASDRGGWDGWIKLRGTATDGSSYGLKLNFATKEFENWAWGGGSEDNNSDKAVIGWVSFNCKNRLSCGTVPYTIATQNFPPKATPIQYLAGDYCKPAESLRGFFQWIFTDPDATDNQDSYKIEVDTDAGFVAPIALTKNGSSTVANGLMGTGALDTPLPSYGTTYYWRVTVWDNLGLGSVAAVGINFSTPAHAYPAPNFTLTPPKPGKDEVVQLCATNNNANWTFEETLNNGATWQASPVTFANSTNNSSENPAIKFTSAGSKRITLTINDGLGECSTVPKGLKVIAIPRWREVSP
ncbi:MAG: hypothetical protein NTV62_00515, partial [Candidatus Gribaldobacteria bacterium]|nr:hypothetical protein [Candidatus Gribaldobacteria bacterium]